MHFISHLWHETPGVLASVGLYFTGILLNALTSVAVVTEFITNKEHLALVSAIVQWGALITLILSWVHYIVKIRKSDK